MMQLPRRATLQKARQTIAEQQLTSDECCQIEATTSEPVQVVTPGRARTLDPLASKPTRAQFPGENFTLSAGGIVFHLASGKVVLCYHTRDEYWFLPKGRKNMGETLERASMRESFEESGYRARLIGTFKNTNQTPPGDHELFEEDTGFGKHQGATMRTKDTGAVIRYYWTKDPIWTEMVPVGSKKDVLYQVFWYVGETLPPNLQKIDEKLDDKVFYDEDDMPGNLTIAKRIAMEPAGYEPPWKANTGVDEEEAFYRAELIDVKKAQELLGGLHGLIIERAWKGICERNLKEGGKQLAGDICQ